MLMPASGPPQQNRGRAPERMLRSTPHDHFRRIAGFLHYGATTAFVASRLNWTFGENRGISLAR